MKVLAKLVESYSKVMEIFFKGIRAALAVALVIMVVVTSMEVVRRYLFGLSFVWAEELVKFLLVAVTFLGGAAAYRAGGMAYLDLITSRFSAKKQRNISIINNVVVIATCLYLSLQGFTYAFSPMVAKMNSIGLKLNMTVVYITIPIGFVLITVFALEQILKAIVEIQEEKKGA